MNAAAGPGGRPMGPHTRRVTLAAVIGLIALIALYALRLLISAFNGSTLHIDEAQYWDWSRHLQWGYYSKPPLIAALIRLSTTLFGDGEAGVRALAMACYPLTAIVLWALGRDLEAARPIEQGVNAGRWAAALFIVSPLAAMLGLVATTDAPLLLCWALALWALWHALANASGLRRGLAWAGFALACGVGLLDKYTMGAMLPGAMLFVAVGAWRRRRAPADGPGAVANGFGLIAASLVALLIWSPNLAWNAAAGWPTLRHTAEITVQATGQHGWAALGAFAGFAIGQGLILAPLLLPCWAWRAWRERGVDRSSWPAGAAALLLCTSLPLASVGLLQAARGKTEVNWIAPVLLAAALGAALRFAPRAGPQPARHRRTWIVLLIAQGLLLTAIAAAPLLQRGLAAGRDVPYLLDGWGRMRGWDGAFAEMAPALQANPGAIVIGTSRTVMAHAAYHWRRIDPPRMAGPVGAVPNSHYELTCPWRAGDPGRFLVLSEGEPPEDLARALGGLRTLATGHVRRSSSRVELLVLSQPLQARSTPPAASSAAAASPAVCR